MYEEKELKIIDDVNIFKNSELSKEYDQYSFYGSGYRDTGLELLFYSDNSYADTTREEDKYNFTIGTGSPFNGYLYWTYNLEDGNISAKRIRRYQYYVEGRAVGLVVKFHKNGNLKEVKNGILCGNEDASISLYHGPHFKWYENGNLKQEGYYSSSEHLYNQSEVEKRNVSEVLYRKYDIHGNLLSSRTELEQKEIEANAFENNLNKDICDVTGSRIFYDYYPKAERERDTSGYFKRGLEIMKKVKVPYIEIMNKALAAGTDVRNHVPNFMPENMNPLNGVRKPLILD